MDTYLDSLLRLFDYAGSYVMLKLIRTILLSTLLMCLILLLRKLWEWCGGRKNAAAGLYGKAYLWLVLLPVPFMGALKLSTEHFHLRNRLYIILYECVMTHAMIARLYFLGMAVTVLIVFIRKKKLRVWVKRLPVCERVFPCGSGKQMANVQIRTTPLCITPFTTGIVKHTIVLPEYILREFDEEEIETVLRHEYCHIRRGHLFIYAVLELFRILWYVNPLVHLCAKQVKNDLELICDHEVIRMNGYDPEYYGMTLLKSVKFLQTGQGKRRIPPGSGGTYCGDSEKRVPAFIREQSFAVMKRRMRSIAGYRDYPKWQRRILYMAAGVVLFSLFLFAHLASYPAYTLYGDYSLYSMDGKQNIISENEAFNAAVTRRDDGLLVDNRKVKELLGNAEIYNDKGEYWIYYGGYMKMPGIGGGGDLLYYSAADAPDDMTLLPYNKTNWLIELVDWMLKHI